MTSPSACCLIGREESNEEEEERREGPDLSRAVQQSVSARCAWPETRLASAASRYNVNADGKAILLAAGNSALIADWTMEIGSRTASVLIGDWTV